MQRLALFMGLSFPPILSISSIPLSHSTGSLRLSSSTFNLKGSNIYVTSNGPYAEQCKQDFKLFLRLRSKELVPNGGMLLNFMGRFDTAENITVPGLIRMVLYDMVSEVNITYLVTINLFNLIFLFYILCFDK